MRDAKDLETPVTGPDRLRLRLGLGSVQKTSSPRLQVFNFPVPLFSPFGIEKVEIGAEGTGGENEVMNFSFSDTKLSSQRRPRGRRKTKENYNMLGKLILKLYKFI